MVARHLREENAAAWSAFGDRFLRGEAGPGRAGSPWLLVPPHADVFASEAGQLGGVCAASARRAMEVAGFHPQPEGLPADHIGLLCDAMAHLEAARAEAERADRDALAQRISERGQEFLRAQVLPWLPALAVAVSLEAPAWGDEVRALARLAAAYEIPPVAQPDKPPNPLDRDGATLLEVCTWLVRPRWSGWWLSPRVLGRLGAAGVGVSRARQLEAVWRAGGREHAAEVRGVLLEELVRWREGYARMSAIGLPVQAWFMRMSVTGVVLRRMEEVIEREAVG